MRSRRRRHISGDSHAGSLIVNWLMNSQLVELIGLRFTIQLFAFSVDSAEPV